jgi:tetratricopeptide (TPR) repeat protein
MRLFRHRLALAAILILSACGRSTPPSPAPSAQADVTATSQPQPSTDAPAASADVAPAPAADAQPAPKAEVDPNTYLVWWQTDRGDVTSWVVADGEGVRIEASRPQVMVFADETLFGLEMRYIGFTETNCEDFENNRKTRSGKKWLPYLVARGLAGREVDQVRELTPRKSGYSADEPAVDGVFELVGEHWGRSHKWAGSWKDLVLVNDCEGAYGCGAHGDMGCTARAIKLGPDAPQIELEKVAQHLAPLTKELLATWTTEDGEISPELDHFFIKSKKGAVEIEYVYVASIFYAGTDGTWSSYSQTRRYTGAPVESLSLGELPAVVKKALEKAGVDGPFGWSIVKQDQVDAARRAFDDPSTIPGPAPADEPAPASGETTASLVETGRKLTRERDFANAITAFDKVIENEPKHARAWSGRGFAKLGQDDLDGARADFEKALTLEDDAKFQAAVYFNLGQIAEKQKDTATAISHYEKAIGLSPSDAAQKRLDALKKR